MAPWLLNKVLAVHRAASGWRWVRIVEVEAYDESDPASHSFGGPRGRNVVMYGEAARVYVYFTYGMHWCANIVTGPVGRGQAVLLRAGEPLGGVEAMADARGGGGAGGGGGGGRAGGRGGRAGDGGGRAGGGLRDLCRGPARLAQALGFDGSETGTEVLTGRGRVPSAASALVVAVLDDGVEPPAQPAVGPRVGIAKGTEVPWRWWVPESPWVSAWRPGRRRPPS